MNLKLIKQRKFVGSTDQLQLMISDINLFSARFGFSSEEATILAHKYEQSGLLEQIRESLVT